LLVSIPQIINESNESNPVDSHHLVFRDWLFKRKFIIQSV